MTATVTEADLEAINGVIHIVDKVISFPVQPSLTMKLAHLDIFYHATHAGMSSSRCLLLCCRQLNMMKLLTLLHVAVLVPAYGDEHWLDHQHDVTIFAPASDVLMPVIEALAPTCLPLSGEVVDLPQAPTLVPTPVPATTSPTSAVGGGAQAPATSAPSTSECPTTAALTTECPATGVPTYAPGTSGGNAPQPVPLESSQRQALMAQAVGSAERPYIFFVDPDHVSQRPHSSSKARSATSALFASHNLNVAMLHEQSSSSSTDNSTQDVFEEMVESQPHHNINGFHDSYNLTQKSRWEQVLMQKLNSIDPTLLKLLVNAHIAHPAAYSTQFTNNSHHPANLTDFNGYPIHVAEGSIGRYHIDGTSNTSLIYHDITVNSGYIHVLNHIINYTAGAEPTAPSAAGYNVSELCPPKATLGPSAVQPSSYPYPHCGSTPSTSVPSTRSAYSAGRSPASAQPYVAPTHGGNETTSCPPGNKVCYVLDPFRFEVPWVS